MVLGSSPVAVTSPSDLAPASSKEFLDIQATIECGFTLKRVRDMTRTYRQFERESIKELKENNDMILKKSDKGGGWVVMDRDYYINHIVLNGHLNKPIYKPIQSNADQKAFKNLCNLVNRYSSSLTKKEKEYVLDNTWKTSKFYCTIKTHKCKSI